jgi:hypothetical protein
MEQNVTVTNGSVSTGVESHLTKDTLDRVRIKNFVFILIYMLIGEVNLSNLVDFFLKKNSVMFFVKVAL